MRILIGLNTPLCQRILAAIGPGDGLKQVAVRVGKIDTAPPEVMIDSPGQGAGRIGPVIQPACAKSVKYRIEFAF